MKKKYLLLILIVLMTVGCSIKEIDPSNYDELVDDIVLNNQKFAVNSYNGFSLYIPHGLKTELKDDYNLILRDKYDNYYYIYVDVVSYYNKVDNKYKLTDDSYFTKKITSKDGKNKGFLEIKEKNDKYFVQGLYNYVKIEVYSSKKELSDTVINVCEILSSIKYNDKILKTTIGENILNYKEETYNIFTNKKSSTNYLDYIEKYDSGASDSKVKTKDEDTDVIDTKIKED